MASAKVIVDKRFLEYERQMERGVQRAIGRAAAIGVAASRGAATGGYRVGEITGSTKVQPPVVRYRSRGRTGWLLSIVASDWRSLFFELGTNKRRRRKLSPKTIARRNTASGQARQAKVANQRGVRALYFLNKGVRELRSRMIDLLQSELGRIR